MPTPDHEPTILAHSARARRSVVMYLVLAVAAVFVWAPFAISPEVDCREYPCPLWLRGVIFGLGALFGGGVLLAMIRGTAWGSRIDLSSNEIVWWHGPPGTAELRIPIYRISRIVVLDGDSVTLNMFDDAGRRVILPSECVLPPIADWAREIGRRNPGIEVELKG